MCIPLLHREVTAILVLPSWRNQVEITQCYKDETVAVWDALRFSVHHWRNEWPFGEGMRSEARSSMSCISWCRMGRVRAWVIVTLGVIISNATNICTLLLSSYIDPFPDSSTVSIIGLSQKDVLASSRLPIFTFRHCNTYINVTLLFPSFIRAILLKSFEYKNLEQTLLNAASLTFNNFCIVSWLDVLYLKAGYLLLTFIQHDSQLILVHWYSSSWTCMISMNY